MTARFRSLAALGSILALLLTTTAIPLQAQATINTTTLAAAQTASGSGPSTVTLTSASTVAVGQMIYVDRELEQITGTTPTSTIFTVLRGAGGTQRADHANATVVYTGPPNYFNSSTYQYEPSGPCVASAQVATPSIYVQSGNFYLCQSSTWKVFKRGGMADSPLYAVGTTYAASGAITIEPGIVTLSTAGALAMTLASPTVAQNGLIMIITSSTAQAHTVTYTAGFNNGGAARDVATYSVIGSTLVIVDVNGIWNVIAATAVAIA